jgi:ABC-type uncharacterized transport system ATPase subunit
LDQRTFGRLGVFEFSCGIAPAGGPEGQIASMLTSGEKVPEACAAGDSPWDNAGNESNSAAVEIYGVKFRIEMERPSMKGLFLNMSVLENVMAATYGNTRAMPWESVLRLPRARREEREVRALAEDVLSFFGQRLAGYRWEQPAYSLSYANRRRLEIARALATSPRLLLLDEPAAGMNPAETHEITELISRLRDERGVAILVIEHDMHVVDTCSDRVVALDHGVKIAEGGFDQVAAHPAVVESYLGRDPDALSDTG